MSDPAGNERVTMAVLSSQLLDVSKQIDNLCKQYDVDHDKITVNAGRVGTLEALALRPPGLCPAHDNVLRDIVDLRLDVAKLGVTSGMAGGGVVSAVGLGLFGLFKLLGWI
jgi:hypothetical protein